MTLPISNFSSICNSIGNNSDLQPFQITPDACEVREHSGVIESVAEVMNNDWPRYTSDLHLNKLDSVGLDQYPKKRIICKILLIFADDGVADSQRAIDISKTVDNEVGNFPLF